MQIDRLYTEICANYDFYIFVSIDLDLFHIRFAPQLLVSVVIYFNSIQFVSITGLETHDISMINSIRMEKEKTSKLSNVISPSNLKFLRLLDYEHSA